MRKIVIIPASGKGVRSGFLKPKQYIKVNGIELIVYTLLKFQYCKKVDEIVIAASEQYFNLLKKLIKKYRIDKVSKIVKGGKERQNSVFNALTSLDAMPNDLIIVHDAARPLIPNSILLNAITLAESKGNAIVALKAKDTLVKGASFIKDYLNRDEVYLVQTPQIFQFKDLKVAFDAARKEKFIGTDESMLVKRTGKRVFIAEGSALNLKVTTKEDFKIFKKLIA